MNWREKEIWQRRSGADWVWRRGLKSGFYSTPLSDSANGRLRSSLQIDDNAAPPAASLSQCHALTSAAQSSQRSLELHLRRWLRSMRRESQKTATNCSGHLLSIDLSGDGGADVWIGKRERTALHAVGRGDPHLLPLLPRAIQGGHLLRRRPRVVARRLVVAPRASVVHGAAIADRKSSQQELNCVLRASTSCINLTKLRGGHGGQRELGEDGLVGKMGLWRLGRLASGRHTEEVEGRRRPSSTSHHPHLHLCVSVRPRSNPTVSARSRRSPCRGAAGRTGLRLPRASKGRARDTSSPPKRLPRLSSRR